MSKLPVVNVHNVRKYAPVIYIASLIAISVFLLGLSSLTRSSCFTSFTVIELRLQLLLPSY